MLVALPWANDFLHSSSTAYLNKQMVRAFHWSLILSLRASRSHGTQIFQLKWLPFGFQIWLLIFEFLVRQEISSENFGSRQKLHFK